MHDVFDIYTIIFLALAVFIFLRLRSVLGQRTGRERPPYDPYSARDKMRPAAEKVISLPNRAAETQKPAEKPADVPAATPTDRWNGVAAAGSPVAAGLDATSLGCASAAVGTAATVSADAAIRKRGKLMLCLLGE